MNTETCRYTDGKGTSAQFCNFVDLSIDGEGNVVVPDRYNHRIRKITPAGVVTTYLNSGGLELDGPLAEATATYLLRTEYHAVSKNLFMSSHSGANYEWLRPMDLILAWPGLLEIPSVTAIRMKMVKQPSLMVFTD